MEKTKRISSVKKIRELAPDVHEFTLGLEEDFVFEAGQFLAIHFEKDTEEITRFYSIVSSPSDKREVKIAVKLLPGEERSASRYFENLEIGDELVISGPTGRLIFQGEKNKVVMLATGTGITPLLSILRNKLPAAHQVFELYFGLRKEEDIFYKDSLEELSQKYHNFHYRICLSQASENWQGERGHITDHLKEISNLGDSEFYLCGKPEMVQEAIDYLLSQNVVLENILTEAY